MIQYKAPGMVAETDNARFEKAVHTFLKKWLRKQNNEKPLCFDQTMDEYLAGDALRDFFMLRPEALHELLQKPAIYRHLARKAEHVHFDPLSGDPLFSRFEQRIYNLARRTGTERVHIPFRSVQPNKQTDAGDTADMTGYPPDSELLRYNSGNHFASRPANSNVFEHNSRLVTADTADHLQVYFQPGFLEDRLQDVIALTHALQLAGRREDLYFVICSRHSPKEGHYGVALVVMDPVNPLFPKRAIICDTLLKELPQHPRWWPHFIEEFSNVFGPAVIELIEDASHPLQKVNIKGDQPYNHDWDCPYYAAAMARALAGLVIDDRALIGSGTLTAIHDAMAVRMPEYYHPCGLLKERPLIRQANHLKRWNSGQEQLRQLAASHREKRSNTTPC